MNDQNTQPDDQNPADAGAFPPPPPPPPPAGDAAASPVPVTPPQNSPLQSDEELSEDQFITGGDDHSFITGIPVPPHPQTQFDDQKFLALLAGSISLTKTEKQRIIGSIPKLSQFQIDELIRIFEEEKQKFAELNKKHADQMQTLSAEKKNDWDDIELQAKQEAAKSADEQKAEEIRKNLGL